MKLTNKIAISDRTGGLFYCCMGIVILYLSRPVFPGWHVSTPGRSLISLLVWTIIFCGWGTGLIINGIRHIMGTEGYEVDPDLRQVLVWKRRFFLAKRFTCISFDQLKQIRVKCVKRGFAVDHWFFGIFIDYVDGEMEIDCFEEKEEAEKYAREITLIAGLRHLNAP